MSFSVSLRFTPVCTYPGYLLLNIHAKDAFQTVKRSVVLERMSKITGLEAQTTFWHARHNARPMLLVGPLRNRLFDDDDTRGDSEEGVMQGAPDSPAVFCVATQDELVSLDNAVAMEGGTARAFMDDVAVVATPRTGFMAIAEYIKNIGRAAGVRIAVRTESEGGFSWLLSGAAVGGDSWGRGESAKRAESVLSWGSGLCVGEARSRFECK